MKKKSLAEEMSRKMAPNINARQTTKPALDMKTTLISSTTPRKEALASSISNIEYLWSMQINF